MATVSATLGIHSNRLCIGDASKGDIGCPSYAPQIDASGLLSADSISATSLFVGGNEITGEIGVTDTMVENWPDAILCSNGAPTLLTYFFYGVNSTHAFYRQIDSSDPTITYLVSGSYNSNSGSGSMDCVTNAWSIAQLYANNRAFNFIGGQTEGGASDWYGIGAIPAQIQAVSNSGDVTFNTLNLAPSSATCSGPSDYGTLRRVSSTGKLQICLDR